MKKSFIGIIIIFVLVLVVLGIIFLPPFLMYIYTMNNVTISDNIENMDSDSSNHENIVEQNDIARKYIADKRDYDYEIDKKYGKGISNLYSVVDECFSEKSNITQTDISESFHMNKRVEYDDLSNLRKLISILNCSKKNEFKFPQDEYLIEKLDDYSYYLQNGEEVVRSNFSFAIIFSNIKETASEIFKDSSDISFDNIDNGYGLAYSYIDNKYIYHGYEGGGLGVVDYGYSEIQDIKKEDEFAYIYDKCVYVDYAQSLGIDSTDDGLIHIYKFFGDVDEIGAEEDVSDFGDDEYSTETLKAIYDKYENKLATFKHTFKRSDDDNYYWVSSEPVE